MTLKEFIIKEKNNANSNFENCKYLEIRLWDSANEDVTDYITYSDLNTALKDMAGCPGELWEVVDCEVLELWEGNRLVVDVEIPKK